jgi:Beta/Gamma crystallin
MRSLIQAATKIAAVATLVSFSLTLALQAAPPPKKPPPPPPRTFTRTTTVNRTTTRTTTINRTVNRPVNTPGGNNPQFRRPIGGGPGGPGPGPGPGRGPALGGPARLGPAGGAPLLRAGPGFGGGLRTGPGRPIAGPIPGRTFATVNVGGRAFRINRGPHFLFFHGVRRAFVPIGLLGVAFWGGSYWYPDSYVSVAAPYCSGTTENGCQLYWRPVDFDGGESAPQCVQYCPQSGPPPAQFTTMPPPPAPPPAPTAGACQMTIFADANMAGTSAPTGDNQPDLSQSGWQNAIASMKVDAGTWDFFSENDFGGESLRLPPGSYPTLPPEWVKKINSFMCVEPGPSA